MMTNSPASDLDELAAEGEKSSTDLADLVALAMKQLELEGIVAKYEEALNRAKADLRKISQGQLPEALKNAKVPSFTLDNGMQVSYSEDLSVSVPKARKPQIIENMKEWGYGGSVTNVLTIDLGKGDNNTAAVLIDQAKEMGLEATLTQDIATGTVKKALKERMAKGESDDLTFYGAFNVTKATVK